MEHDSNMQFRSKHGHVSIWLGKELELGVLLCENAEAQGLQGKDKHLCQHFRSPFNLQVFGHCVSGRQVSHEQLEEQEWQFG